MSKKNIIFIITKASRIGVLNAFLITRIKPVFMLPTSNIRLKAYYTKFKTQITENSVCINFKIQNC